LIDFRRSGANGFVSFVAFDDLAVVVVKLLRNVNSRQTKVLEKMAKKHKDEMNTIFDDFFSYRMYREENEKNIGTRERICVH
jgi:predicted peptidase